MTTKTRKLIYRLTCETPDGSANKISEITIPPSASDNEVYKSTKEEAQQNMYDFLKATGYEFVAWSVCNADGIVLDSSNVLVVNIKAKSKVT